MGVGGWEEVGAFADLLSPELLQICSGPAKSVREKRRLRAWPCEWSSGGLLQTRPGEPRPESAGDATMDDRARPERDPGLSVEGPEELRG